jgi:hypothetical protein
MDKLKVNEIDVSQTEKETKESAIMLSRANEIVITNQTTYEQSIVLRMAIKDKLKIVDTLRKSITKPLDEAKAKVMDLFRPITTNLDMAEKRIKEIVINYENEQERKRREAEAKLQAEAEKKRIEAMRKAEEARAAGKENIAEKYEAKAESVPTPIIAPTFERPKGFSTRTIWKYRIKDESLIPRSYLMPDEKKLSKQATATHDSIQIPGIEFYSVEI